MQIHREVASGVSNHVTLGTAAVGTRNLQTITADDGEL